MIKLFFLILLLGACIGCKPANQSNENGLKSSLPFHARFTAIPNESGDYILYIQKTDSELSQTSLSFVVINKMTNQKILEKTIRPGYVKWISRYTLEFLDMPGMLTLNEDISMHIRQINIKENNQ